MELPEQSVVKTSLSNARGCRYLVRVEDPTYLNETEKQNIKKQNHYCNKFNNDFLKNGHIKNNVFKGGWHQT